MSLLERLKTNSPVPRFINFATESAGYLVSPELQVIERPCSFSGLLEKRRSLQRFADCSAPQQSAAGRTYQSERAPEASIAIPPLAAAGGVFDLVDLDRGHLRKALRARWGCWIAGAVSRRSLSACLYSAISAESVASDKAKQSVSARRRLRSSQQLKINARLNITFIGFAFCNLFCRQRSDCYFAGGDVDAAFVQGHSSTSVIREELRSLHYQTYLNHRNKQYCQSSRC